MFSFIYWYCTHTSQRDIMYYILSDNIVLLYLAHIIGHFASATILHGIWPTYQAAEICSSHRFLHACNHETSLLLNCRCHCNIACLCMMCILKCDPAGSITLTFRWMFRDASLPNTITVCKYVKKFSAAASVLEMEGIPGRYVLCAKF